MSHTGKKQINTLLLLPEFPREKKKEKKKKKENSDYKQKDILND